MEQESHKGDLQTFWCMQDVVRDRSLKVTQDTWLLRMAERIKAPGTTCLELQNRAPAAKTTVRDEVHKSGM